MPRPVLMVSKPVAPPWNDSSKNLVKDLALAGRRFSYHVMTPSGYALPGEGVVSEGIYRRAGGYTPPLHDNARVLRRLLQGDDCALTHFFFAPNPRTSLAARAALTLRRRQTLQTVCSTPASFRHTRLMLFADRIVVVSRHMLETFVAAGVPASRLALIPPGIQLPDPPDPTRRAAARRAAKIPEDHLVVIYPGDYQFSSAARTVARALAALDRQAVTLVFACRIKQAESRRIKEEIRRELDRDGMLDRVRFCDEIPDVLALLSLCDLCVLPAESLFAKMDLPLVLIEAMALGVPLVVADRPPLCEIVEAGGGVTVPPANPGALAATIGALLDDPARRRALGERGRQLCRERFDIVRVSRQYEDLYEEVLGR